MQAIWKKILYIAEVTNTEITEHIDYLYGFISDLKCYPYFMNIKVFKLIIINNCYLNKQLATGQYHKSVDTGRINTVYLNYL